MPDVNLAHLCLPAHCSILLLNKNGATGASKRRQCKDVYLAGEDTTLSNDGHMLPRELLFQLADQTLLNPVEGLEEPEGHVDDDSLAAVTDINLLRGGDEKILQVGLHVGLDLKVEDGTSHELLKSIGLGTTLLEDLVASSGERHPVDAKRTSLSDARSRCGNYHETVTNAHMLSQPLDIAYLVRWF